MKHTIYDLLNQKNIKTQFNIDILYSVGMKNIMDNIEFYYDKQYTCESVIKELFTRGILEYIRKNQVN